MLLLLLLFARRRRFLRRDGGGDDDGEGRLHLGSGRHPEGLSFPAVGGPLRLQEGAGLGLGGREARGVRGLGDFRRGRGARRNRGKRVVFLLLLRRFLRFQFLDLELLQLGRGDERDRCDGVRERRKRTRRRTRRRNTKRPRSTRAAAAVLAA